MCEVVFEAVVHIFYKKRAM